MNLRAALGEPDEWFDGELELSGSSVQAWEAAQLERLLGGCVVVCAVSRWKGRVLGTAAERAEEKQRANKVLGALTTALRSWNGNQPVWKNELPAPDNLQRQAAAALRWEVWLPEWVESAEMQLALGVTVAIAERDARAKWRAYNRVGSELLSVRKYVV